MEEEKVKKSGALKWIIIAIIIIVVLAGAVIGGIFAYQVYENNKSVGTEWGDIYYDYLEKQQAPENKVKTISSNAEEYKVQFIPQEEKTPIMAVQYTVKMADDKIQNHFGIFYINAENKVSNASTFLAEDKDIDLELLYNKEEEKYKWYTKAQYEENYTTYRDIEKLIEASKLEDNLGGYDKALENEKYNKLSKETVITFEEKEMPQEKTEKTTPISKFEETFIVPENVPELEAVTIKDLADLKETKKQLEEAVTGYKTMEEVTTEEVKQSVTETSKKIEERKEAIKKAEEEAKKKAEEEAKKKAEEEAKKGIKAGSYTLKYGTYKNEWGDTYTLNANGRYSANTVLDKGNGTYTVYWYKGFKDEIEEEPAGWTITFKSASGDTTSFYIKGNNWFSALQHQSNFRLK